MTFTQQGFPYAFVNDIHLSQYNNKFKEVLKDKNIKRFETLPDMYSGQWPYLDYNATCDGQALQKVNVS